MSETLIDEINRAARELPDGWEVAILIERGSACVTLYDPHGDKIVSPEPFSVDDAVHEQIHACVDWAKAST